MARALPLLLLLLPAAAPLVTRLIPAARSYAPVPRDLSGKVLLIDGDNVRGKHNFRWTKRQLYDAVARWTHERGPRSSDPNGGPALDANADAPRRWGRVVLFYDHGSDKACYVQQELEANSGVRVVFAGPRDKADDVIVSSIKELFAEGGCGVRLVTSDSGLRSRALRAGAMKINVVMTRSEHFVDQLLKEGCVVPIRDDAENADPTTDDASADADAVARLSGASPRSTTGNRKIAEGLVGMKLMVQKQLRRATGRTKKRKLKRRLETIEDALRETLAAAQAGVDSETETLARMPAQMGWIKQSHSAASAAGADPEKESDAQALRRILAARRATRSYMAKETTADREVLAEEFRAEIMRFGFELESGPDPDPKSEDEPVVREPAKSYGRWLNGQAQA